MLKDCLEIFEEILGENGDKLIIDNYVPPDGTYIVVEISGDEFYMKEPFNIKFDKKNEKIEGDKCIDYYNVRMYDYYSKLIEMNKPIDSKKVIHSNNYLSFSVKKESIGNNKLTYEIIDKFYDILKDPIQKYSSKPKAKLIYQKLEEKIGKVDGELVEKIRSWIKSNVFDLDINKNAKDYLKIFFQFKDDNEKNIELYKKESERYLVPNIYNKNDYNEIVNGEVYGLPSDNMGLNSKKPYLENKTRKLGAPYLIDNDEVILQKKFFDYLSSYATRQKFNIYIDTNKDRKNNIKSMKNGEMLTDDDFRGIYLRIQKGTSLEIIDCDYISAYKYKLKPKFYYKNYIYIDPTKVNNVADHLYGEKENKSQIQELLNEIYFSKFLKGNYFTNANEIRLNNNVKKRNLLTCRNSIFNWLYKGYFNDIDAVLNRASLQIIKNSIINGYNISAINQFNLRWSFIEYFKGEEKMADFLNEVRKNLREKVNYRGDEVEDLNKIDNDTEYYFAIGQEAYYLLSLSKAGNKSQALINPFLNAKNDVVLKQNLKKLFKKYNYAINLNNKKPSKLYDLILGYKPEGKVDEDMIIAGYLSNSLIYEKKEEGEI